MFLFSEFYCTFTPPVSWLVRNTLIAKKTTYCPRLFGPINVQDQRGELIYPFPNFLHFCWFLRPDHVITKEKSWKQFWWSAEPSQLCERLSMSSIRSEAFGFLQRSPGHCWQTNTMGSKWNVRRLMNAGIFTQFYDYFCEVCQHVVYPSPISGSRDCSSLKR